MKKCVFVLLLFASIGSLCADNSPYKPYPIILIHGYSGTSETWGVKPHKPTGDEFNSDSILLNKIIPELTYDSLLNKMKLYAIVWDAIDPSYTKPGDENIPPGEGTYPNKAFLEIYNFKYPTGSFDPDAGGIWPPWTEQEGWGTELRKKIKKTLKEYYGSDWANNPDAIVYTFTPGAGFVVRVGNTITSDIGYKVAKSSGDAFTYKETFNLTLNINLKLVTLSMLTEYNKSRDPDYETLEGSLSLNITM